MGEERGGGGGDQAADDHEGVSLDLSIGGCYQSRKMTAATAAAETSVQVLSVDDHQKEVSTPAGAGGTMTQTSFPKGVMMLEKQRMKREMHALRRFEAMRKREEKQMIKKAAAAASGITTLLKVCSTTPVLRRNPSFDDMRMSPVPVEDDRVNDQEDVGGDGGVYNYKRPLMDVDHEHDQEQLEGGDHHIDQQRKRIATSEQLCPYHPCFRPIPSNPNEGTPFLLRSGSYAYNSPMIWKAHSMRNVGGGGDDFQQANSSALARNANKPQPVFQRSIKQLGGASTNPVSERRLSSSSSSPSTGNINGTRSRLCGHSNPEHCRWNSSAPAILQSAATTVIKTDQAVATDQQNPPISSDAVTLVEGKQLHDAADDDQNQKTGVERKNGIPLIPVAQPRIHMPCVITQGDGSKKIKGRLYKYTKTEVTIICMCHGTLFSPAGFVKHAGGKDVSEPLKQISVIYS